MKSLLRLLGLLEEKQEKNDGKGNTPKEAAGGDMLDAGVGGAGDRKGMTKPEIHGILVQVYEMALATWGTSYQLMLATLT